MCPSHSHLKVRLAAINASTNHAPRNTASTHIVPIVAPTFITCRSAVVRWLIGMSFTNGWRNSGIFLIGKKTPPTNSIGNEMKPAIGPALSGVLARPATINPVAMNASVPRMMKNSRVSQDPFTCVPKNK